MDVVLSSVNLEARWTGEAHRVDHPGAVGNVADDSRWEKTHIEISRLMGR